MKAGGPFTMKISGKNEVKISDILVGEVWVCGGQSNMELPVGKINYADVELASANCAEIRLFQIPKTGSPVVKTDVNAEWKVSTADVVSEFSAVGYLFGKRLHDALGVPVGLIQNPWGGTPIEAFIPRDMMDTTKACADLLRRFDDKMSKYTDETLAQDIVEYQKWLKAGKPGELKYPPIDQRLGNKRPGNLFNGMVYPIAGFGIKGAIWYQGEANVMNPELYTSLFPMMIRAWRKHWGQGDFPFYWVQLANFKEKSELPQASNWAALREAQSKALALPHTGQAVIIDKGEVYNIHPRDKQAVANRLVRHALANEYGFQMVASSPTYQSMSIQKNKIIITFTNVDIGLCTFDVETLNGFAIAGKDQKFVWAKAEFEGKNKVVLYADEVNEPIAVRYGWADNPNSNIFDMNGLPVAPFRTDNWGGASEN